MIVEILRMSAKSSAHSEIMNVGGNMSISNGMKCGGEKRASKLENQPPAWRSACVIERKSYREAVSALAAAKP
jgi:hypothetical protein